MSNATYTDRYTAIFREIIEPLAEWAAGFDIEAIADRVLGDYAEGYACQVDLDEFWAIVQDCEVSA